MNRRGSFYAMGEAAATALVLREALSFWGGVDSATGAIIDHSHPDLGRSVAGQVLVMPCGRGSSSSSSTLAEAIRCGTAPAGIILARADPILTVAAIIAKSLYNLPCPIVVCPIDGIATGDYIRISVADNGDARIEIAPAPRMELAGGDKGP